MANDPCPSVLRLLPFTMQAIDEGGLPLGKDRHLIAQGSEELIVVSSSGES